MLKSIWKPVANRTRRAANVALGTLGLEVITKVRQQQEQSRLQSLVAAGYFEAPVFPVPESILKSDWRSLLKTIEQLQEATSRLKTQSTNQVGYTLDNGFFSTPDAEVLYSVVRHFAPKKILEIGSGNSTKISRQAILDGKLTCQIVSVDPCPRAEIDHLADAVHRNEVEKIPAGELASQLQAGDILFIDSSHQLAVGNDCVHLFLKVLPALPAGVLIHVHDITLPWDYPAEWVQREPTVGTWAEQYVLQLLLTGDEYEVLWPGYYAQRQDPEAFARVFPQATMRDATSFWMRKRIRS